MEIKKEDIEKEITETKKKHIEAVNEINAGEQRKQSLLQEVLRLEGEMRALTRLANKKE